MRGARVAVALASFAVALGASELLLRALDWPRFDACAEPADYAVPDPTLGFAPPPGQSGTVGRTSYKFHYHLLSRAPYDR